MLKELGLVEKLREVIAKQEEYEKEAAAQAQDCKFTGAVD